VAYELAIPVTLRDPKGSRMMPPPGLQIYWALCDLELCISIIVVSQFTEFAQNSQYSARFFAHMLYCRINHF